MALSPDLLEILVCPECRGPLEPGPEGDWLACRACRLKYRIEDDIPIMLADQAEPLEDAGE